MRPRVPQTIDMTPAGDFVGASRPNVSSNSLWPLKLGLAAAALAAVAGVIAVGAVVLWIAMMLLPVALMAGLVAYAAFKFQVWRNRR